MLRGVSERRSVINERPHQIQSLGGGVWVFVLRFLSFFQLFAGFSVKLEPKARLEVWEGKLGVPVGNLRTVRMVYWVNVSESSGTGLPGCTGQMSIKRLGCCWCHNSMITCGITIYCSRSQQTTADQLINYIVVTSSFVCSTNILLLTVHFLSDIKYCISCVLSALY